MSAVHSAYVSSSPVRSIGSALVDLHRLAVDLVEIDDHRRQRELSPGEPPPEEHPASASPPTATRIRAADAPSRRRTLRAGFVVPIVAIITLPVIHRTVAPPHVASMGRAPRGIRSPTPRTAARTRAPRRRPRATRVDRERVPRPGIDDLGDAGVPRLDLVARVGDRGRHRVVLLAPDDEQRPPLGILRVDLRLAAEGVEVRERGLEERRPAAERGSLVQLAALLFAEVVDPAELELLPRERDRRDRGSPDS